MSSLDLGGYVPDSAELRRLYVKWGHRFGLLRAAPQAFRDLRPSAPHVLMQEGSSCTGHGTATGLYTAAAVAGRPIPLPSPCGLYTNAVALDRGDPLAGPLWDRGAMPALVMRGLTEFGWKAMQPANALTDCFPQKGTLAEPTLGDLELEGDHLYIGWYAVADADEARAAIAAGHPVGIGTWVDSSFLDWRPGNPVLGRMNFDDPAGGGHLTVLLASESSSRFWLRNSWGTGWGEAGDALVSDAFVNQSAQLIAFGWKGPQ